MSDQVLRNAERLAAAEGLDDPRHVRALFRAGRLDLERWGLAAALGDPLALALAMVMVMVVVMVMAKETRDRDPNLRKPSVYSCVTSLGNFGFVLFVVRPIATY